MKFKSFVKVALSVLTLGLVLAVVDFSHLKATLKSIPLGLAVLVVLGYSATMVLNTVKWWLIARSAGIGASFPHAVQATFIGMFANFFGVGTLGGDVLRGILLAVGEGSTAEGKKAEGIASVLADRALGMAILALVGLTSTILFQHEHLDGTLLLILSGLAVAILGGWFIGPVIVLRVFPQRNRFRHKLELVLQVFPRSPKKLVLLSGLSVVFHMLQVGLHWLIIQGMGIPVKFSVMLATIPFVNLLSTLPISWNGLGVRENAYIFFLHPQVLSKEQAVALGAVWLLGMTVSSLIGGVVAIVSGNFGLGGFTARREAPVSVEEDRLRIAS